MDDVAIEVRSAGVSTLWLNAPERRNAFAAGMMERLAQAVEALSAEPDCRVLLLRGRGGHFCAGRALARPGEIATEDESARRMAEASHLAQAMQACPKPLVAFVEGWAAGVGVSLAAWADLAVADEGARFVAPELKLGFPPTMTAVTLLRRMERATAMDVLLTGRPFSAAEAKASGLVARTVASAEAEALLDELTSQLQLAGAGAVAAFKRLLCKTEGLDLARSLVLAAEATQEWEASAARSHDRQPLSRAGVE